MRRARRAIKPLRGPSDPRHGQPTGYSYWGCRCQKCRSAHLASIHALRERGEINTHGVGGYNLGCRCQECTTTKHQADKAQRTRRAQWKKTHKPQGRIEVAKLSELA